MVFVTGVFSAIPAIRARCSSVTGAPKVTSRSCDLAPSVCLFVPETRDLNAAQIPTLPLSAYKRNVIPRAGAERGEQQAVGGRSSVRAPEGGRLVSR